MTVKIINATPADVSRMRPHFPRLADFKLPPKRESHHFWKDDAKLLSTWATGEMPDLLVQIAEDEMGSLLGFTMTRMGEEFLSHKPSAHLEVLIVAKGAEGKGVGKQLIAAAEENAQSHGATSITLHVIATNEKARGLYTHLGYSEEIIRNIKHFD
ncbi:MAG: GNAT family N-acetyltransferase [Chloroflexota bacterium]